MCSAPVFLQSSPLAPESTKRSQVWGVEASDFYAKVCFWVGTLCLGTWTLQELLLASTLVNGHERVSRCAIAGNQVTSTLVACAVRHPNLSKSEEPEQVRAVLTSIPFPYLFLPVLPLSLFLSSVAYSLFVQGFQSR